MKSTSTKKKKTSSNISLCVCSFRIGRAPITEAQGGKKSHKIISLHDHNIVYGSYKTLIYDYWQKKEKIFCGSLKALGNYKINWYSDLLLDILKGEKEKKKTCFSEASLKSH